MQKGDWYHLYLDKPRVLSEIIAHSEEDRFPIKTKISIKASRSEEEWQQKAIKDNQISHRFQKCQKIEAIEFKIVEPRLSPLSKIDNNPPAWAIYNIDIIEYRLCGRWWKVKIK